MDPPTRDILINPPAFPASPATTTLLTNPPSTPIQTIQTYDTPDRTLIGIRITWMNGDRATLGVCSSPLPPAPPPPSSSSGHGIGIGTGIGSGSGTGTVGSEMKNPIPNPTTTTTSTNTNTMTTTKTFTFDRQERIQIMYIYVSSTQVEGFWFVTNKQKSFFPGRSSERREMTELGSGVLVGFEGREKRDEEDRVVGILGLGVSFRR